MLKPVKRVAGLKEIYQDMKAGQPVNEMDMSLVADTVLYVNPFQRHGADGSPGPVPYDVLEKQIQTAILEHGDTVSAQGQSKDPEENGWSKIDLLKFRILEGASQLLSYPPECDHFAHIADLKPHEGREMLEMVQKKILLDGIKPMGTLEKMVYGGIGLCAFDARMREGYGASVDHADIAESKPAHRAVVVPQ